MRGDGLFLRCLRSLDDKVNVKLLLRVWGPRVELFVRVLLVATFLDDSVRAATHFSEHVKQVGSQGYLKQVVTPELLYAIATFALGIGLLVQSFGSLCLLALIQPDSAAKALIGWAVVQPVLYAQLANVEFVAESLSLIGGLIILRAHLSEQALRAGSRIPLGGGGLCCAPEDEPEASIARTQLLGRVLLPSVYLYHAAVILRDNVTGESADHTEYSFAMLVTEYAVNLAVVAGLVLSFVLVTAGLRSRAVALGLALVNFGFVCYSHPFFRLVWREGGEWKYDEVETRKPMPHVALPKNVDPENFEPWHIVDLHRYYFFQGLSTSGALLLLAQFGPGEIAIEKDEVILGDVQRARD